MDYILAFDAGTGSLRAVLFDSEGNQIGCSQEEWIHLSDERYPGSMGFDYDANWSLLVGCVRNLLKETGIDSKRIKGISATSMREGIVLYDEEGKEVWACANVDSRASEEVFFLKENHEELEAMLYELSGQTFALGAIPRILWLKNHLPEVYERVSAMTMLNDWILYKLSGTLQVDPSNGCTTGIFDLNKREWASGYLKECWLKDSIFTPVNEAGTVIGEVGAEIAGLTGLAQGTKVVAGGGDAQMASVGAGAIRDGQTVVSGGSFWQQEVNTSKPFIDMEGRIRVNCHAVQDLWQIETIAFFPGLVMRWFRDAFCQEEVANGKICGRDPYELLEEAAKDVPVGSNGIIPIFSDIMNYSSWRHAAPSFINLTLDPNVTGKKEMFRSLQENAALITLGNLKLIEEVTNFYPEEVIFVGGASKGKLWSQTLADVLGVRVKVPVVKESAALGTALYAGVGAGIYSTIQEAAEKIVKWDRIHEPDESNHLTYLEIYEKWRRVYERQLGLADEGTTTHMWKAPGFQPD
ncbi:autoinducer-2 kinase [Rossellomorea vietnamensis]|uniref:Autoinducer-2 kinase n=1 Tax=Rossellomorea vietnamensis TaxID=218284 RepID=A0A5D4MHN2_9BACI|nr:autoinducer-2 kinase [Rossellomorea vietnamensis]TYS01253.1 autoinducer-2 kinase [Rossellomorea vietnamensis]